MHAGWHILVKKVKHTLQLTDVPYILLSQVFDNYAVTVMIGGEPYTLGLFDTAGKNIYLFVYSFN